MLRKPAPRLHCGKVPCDSRNWNQTRFLKGRANSRFSLPFRLELSLTMRGWILEKRVADGCQVEMDWKEAAGVGPVERWISTWALPVFSTCVVLKEPVPSNRPGSYGSDLLREEGTPTSLTHAQDSRPVRTHRPLREKNPEAGFRPESGWNSCTLSLRKLGHAMNCCCMHYVYRDRVGGDYFVTV